MRGRLVQYVAWAVALCVTFVPSARARLVVGDQLVVRGVGDTISPAAIHNLFHMLGKPIDRCSGRHRRPVYLVHAPRTMTLQTLNEQLKPMGFEAQPNFVYTLENWPIHPDQWPLENDGSGGGVADVDINAGAAWEGLPQPAAGKPVPAVAVIDTGVAYKHDDLEAAVWVNSKEAEGSPGVDDDDNGYVDDIHGFNATTVPPPPAIPDPNAKILAGDPDDNTLGVGYGHGTAVAGIIAAVHNEEFVAGVARGAKIVACKAFPSQHVGGANCTTCDAIKCLAYVDAVKANPHDKSEVDIVAVNLSWGQLSTTVDTALQDAIRTQRERGTLVVASAGNDNVNTDCKPHYPSSFTHANLISVAETNNRDEVSGESNWGRRSVHVLASGYQVPVLTPSPLSPNEINTLWGTSMAAAHVSGLIALLQLKNIGNQPPPWDWKALRNLAIAGGTSIPAKTSMNFPKPTASNRRIRASEPSEQEGDPRNGSLSCVKQLVQARLQPITGCVTTLPVSDALELASGARLPIVFANLDCAGPKAPLTARITDECQRDHTKDLPLLDDGIDFDEVAGDGYYSARWDPWTTPQWSTTWSGWRRLKVETFETGNMSNPLDVFGVCRAGTTCKCS